MDILIKRGDERLGIIDFAKRVFANEAGDVWVEYKEGFDAGRWCWYKVHCAEGFPFEGVDFPLKVAMIEEYYPKRKKRKSFL